MKKVRKHYIDLKSISKNRGLVGDLFPSRYRFSPYRGCQHGCRYCDGRAEKYYVEGDFEKDIVVRKNIPQLVEEELSSIREKGIISISSGVSDPYHPLEEEERIVERTLQVIEKYNLPISIMTKSSLILRDIDILERINKKSGVTVMVSLTFLDESLASFFEPRANSVEERLTVIKKFKERGIGVGVLAMPFIPYISDSKESMDEFFSKLEEIGVDFVSPGDLTLRPGKQKELFMEGIRANYPALYSKLNYLYGENRPSGIMRSSYRNKLYKKIYHLLDQYSISYLFPHSLYKGKLPLYDEVYLLLVHMKELYYRKGVDVKPLEVVVKRYVNWLEGERSKFNRRRSLNYTDLEQELLFLLHSGGFLDLIGNKKVNEFIKEIILEEKVFDYVSLSNKA
ncbi:SPL family radical SAM protein [Halonatronum saccharophilum]|uniref:SPL family radical SAM protein n=1 Tax=Halonatronum saccharophilum TaxID=150060 RepID=UPI00047F279E|nr:radical SAM protein [Halonatronum saccharophilum]